MQKLIKRCLVFTHVFGACETGLCVGRSPSQNVVRLLGFGILGFYPSSTPPPHPHPCVPNPELSRRITPCVPPSAPRITEQRGARPRTLTVYFPKLERESEFNPNNSKILNCRPRFPYVLLLLLLWHNELQMSNIRCNLSNWFCLCTFYFSWQLFSIRMFKSFNLIKWDILICDGMAKENRAGSAARDWVWTDVPAMARGGLIDCVWLKASGDLLETS